MILITRPHHLAVRTAGLIKNMGLECMIAPVLDVRFLCSDLEDKDYDAAIITSQNSVYACRNLNWLKNKKIYAVGKSTAGLLSEFGFNNVLFSSSNEGNLENLILHIINNQKKGSRLLYISGNHITGDLQQKELLSDYIIDRKIVYKSFAISEFSSDIVDLIKEKIETVLLYSPRSAKVFKQLSEKYNINLAKKNAVCISDNTCSQIESLRWKKIYVAKFPTESEVIMKLNILYNA